ncbi:MAG: hypothetical protein IPI95_01870 [Flavobacteriales bacterium]|nr:hypothetical protein [Flavobacteriales bacterium]
MEAYGIETVAALARALGHAQSKYVSQVMKGDDPSWGMLQDLYHAFQGLNMQWLVTGGGPLELTQDHYDIQGGTELAILANKGAVRRRRSSEPVRKGTPAPYLWHLPAMVTIDHKGDPNVVMIDAQAAAGLPMNYENQAYYKGRPTLKLPGQLYRSGTFIAIEVLGDSMIPTIHSKDWLIARHLEVPLEHQREGCVHVVVTDEGVVAKRLYRTEGHYAFTLRSDNELYPPYQLLFSEVLQLYRVEAIFSENLTSRR